MSPEQTGFSIDDVDTRADIYSLGVILYELLAGLRPIDAKRLKQAALTEMIRIVQEEEPSRPSTRLSTDDSLPSLAALRQIEPRRLMALLRGDLDWVVMKCLEKQRDRRYETANALARDIQRYLDGDPVEACPPSLSYRLSKIYTRHKGRVIAASLVLLALVGGVVGTSIGLWRANESAAKERAANTAAQAARIEAEKARDRTRDVLDAMVSEVTGDSLTTQKTISPEQQKFLENVLGYYREFGGENPDDERSRARHAQAANRVGLIESRLGRKEESVAANRLALESYASLAADFSGVSEYREALAASHLNLGGQLEGLGQLAEAEDQYRSAMTILKKLAMDFPDEPRHRFDLSKSHNGLGILFAGLGQTAAAEEHFRECLTIREKLVGEFPGETTYRQNLAMSYTNIGVLLNDLGQGSLAAEQYRKGLEIREKLAADFPTVAEYRASLALGHLNLANVLAGRGQSAAAEEQYRKGIARLEKLTADFPVVPKYRQHLAASQCNLAALQAALGQQTAAVELHRKALAIRENLVTEFSAVPIYRAELSDSHNNLGLVLAELGELEQAKEQYQKALLIDEALAAGFPGVPEYQISLGGHHCNFGSLMLIADDSEASLAYFGLAIDYLTPVLEQEPRNGTARQFLANSYLGRAQAQDRLQKFAEAASDYQQAIALSPPPQQSLIRASRASSLHKAGMTTEAVAEVAALVESPNWSALQWYNFACIYSVSGGRVADHRQEYLDRAMELLQRAVSAGFKDAALLEKDTDLEPLREREDFMKILEELEQTAKSQVRQIPAGQQLELTAGGNSDTS